VNRLWLKLPKDQNFHAVYTPAPGGYWTACGKFHRAKAVEQFATVPDGERSPLVERRCSSCVTRMDRAFLIPPQLQRVKADYEQRTAR